MLSADSSKRSTARNSPGQLAKTTILLVSSLGLLWFSVEFSSGIIFESHTCPGGRCQGSIGWILWMSYAKDLIQPFAFYFVLCLGERWLRTWRHRILLAFTIPTILEFGQFLYYRVHTGHYVGVFDPLDIIMYATGVAAAALVERKIFTKYLAFW